MRRKVSSCFLIALAIGSPFAALRLLSGTAVAGNAQPYEGPSLTVLSSPAATETNTEAECVPGPSVAPSVSRVATNQTGNEREAVFDGMAAGSGGRAFAGK